MDVWSNTEPLSSYTDGNIHLPIDSGIRDRSEKRIPHAEYERHKQQSANSFGVVTTVPEKKLCTFTAFKVWRNIKHGHKMNRWTEKPVIKRLGRPWEQKSTFCPQSPCVQLPRSTLDLLSQTDFSHPLSYRTVYPTSTSPSTKHSSTFSKASLKNEE